MDTKLEIQKRRENDISFLERNGGDNCDSGMKQFQIGVYSSMLKMKEETQLWLRRAQHSFLLSAYSKYITDANFYLWSLETCLVVGDLSRARELANMALLHPVKVDGALTLPSERCSYRDDLLDYLTGRPTGRKPKKHRIQKILAALRADDNNAFLSEASKLLKTHHTRVSSKRSIDWNGPRGFMNVELLISIRLATERGFCLTALRNDKKKTRSQTIKLVALEKPESEVELKVDYLPDWIFEEGVRCEEAADSLSASNENEVFNELENRIKLCFTKADGSWEPRFHWDRAHCHVLLGQTNLAKEAFGEAFLFHAEERTDTDSLLMQIKKYRVTFLSAILSSNLEHVKTICSSPLLKTYDEDLQFHPRGRNLVPKALTLILLEKEQEALSFIQEIEGRKTASLKQALLALCERNDKNLNKALFKVAKEHIKESGISKDSRDSLFSETIRFFFPESTAICCVATHRGMSIDYDHLPTNEIEVDPWHIMSPLPKEASPTLSIIAPPVPSGLITRALAKKG